MHFEGKRNVFLSSKTPGLCFEMWIYSSAPMRHGLLIDTIMCHKKISSFQVVSHTQSRESELIIATLTTQLHPVIFPQLILLSLLTSATTEQHIFIACKSLSQHKSWVSLKILRMKSTEKLQQYQLQCDINKYLSPHSESLPIIQLKKIITGPPNTQSKWFNTFLQTA